MDKRVIFQNYAGSPAHYYHFFYGVFLPLTAYILDHECDSITLQDCGPMNRHLFSHPAVASGRVSLKVAPLEELASQGAEVVPGWDFAHEKRRMPARYRRCVSRHTHMVSTRNDVRKLLRDGYSVPDDQQDLAVLVHRTRPQTGLLTSDAGANRRRMNTREIHDALVQASPPFEVRLFVPEEHTLEEQAKVFASAKMIVAQHGAALANLYFSNVGCKVLEINRAGRMYFPLMSRLMGLRHDCWDFHNKKNCGLRVPPGEAVERILGLWSETGTCTSSPSTE